MRCVLRFVFIGLCWTPSLLRADEIAPRAVLFSAFEASRSAYFVSSGAKFALWSHLHQGGARLFLSSGSGVEHLRSGKKDRDLEAALLAGHEWHGSSTQLAVYAGGETLEWSPRMGREKRRFGGRLMLETSRSLSSQMDLRFSAVAGSTRPHIWAQLELGIRASHPWRVGSLLSFHAENDYSKARVAGFVETQLFDGIVGRAQLGWQVERAKRHSPFVQLSFYRPF